jgi:hypothetical protein
MTQRSLRLLFLTDDREDYLADGVLHGLRQLPHVELVDWPRKDCLYKGGRHCRVAPKFAVRGGGFSLYGLLQESAGEIDRSQIWRRLEGGWFDAVVISNVWRQWGLLLQWQQLLTRLPLLLLDGDDDERLYPRSGTRLRQFGLGTGLDRLLQAPSTHIFKREFTPRSRAWGLRLQLHHLGFSIPETAVVASVPLKTQLFPAHIVDEELCIRVGGSASYAFADEAAYRADLGASRFGITTRRAGWDCLRHYEIAASGTIPCFRDLLRKPPRCAPHGLIDGVNCLSYSSVDELLGRIKGLSPSQEALLQQRALAWAGASSTKQRAIELLSLGGLIARTHG